jgi:hypothetical protein
MTDNKTLQEKLVEVLAEQTKLQQKLIDSQQEVIELRKKIEAMTPARPTEDVHWNKVYGGLASEEALAIGDLATLKALREWIFKFGEKYLKPYIHPEAYAETMAHMTRGIAKRMSDLEMQTEFGTNAGSSKTLELKPTPNKQVQIPKKSRKKTVSKKPMQKRLLDD